MYFICFLVLPFVAFCLLLIGLDFGYAILPIAAGVTVGVPLDCWIGWALYLGNAAFGSVVCFLAFFFLDLALNIVEVVFAHVGIQVVAWLAAEYIPPTG